MCTVTLHRAPNTLLVTMNRDEALVRGPETPPQHHSGGGASWIAPHDSDRGGTWMGVNQFGVVACLLNAYRPDEDLRPHPERPYPSRGAIIPSILPLGPFPEVERHLRETFDPSLYPSFTLYAAGLDHANSYEWYRDGGWNIQPVSNPWHMRTSSGWDTADVTAWRTNRFDAWLQSGSPMIYHAPTFHFLLEAGAEERSPLMRRAWSATRSVTQAEIDSTARKVTLRYWPNPQSGGGPADALCELDLR